MSVWGWFVRRHVRVSKETAKSVNKLASVWGCPPGDVVALSVDWMRHVLVACELTGTGPKEGEDLTPETLSRCFGRAIASQALADALAVSSAGTSKEVN